MRSSIKTWVKWAYRKKHRNPMKKAIFTISQDEHYDRTLDRYSFHYCYMMVSWKKTYESICCLGFGYVFNCFSFISIQKIDFKNKSSLIFHIYLMHMYFAWDFKCRANFVSSHRRSINRTASVHKKIINNQQGKEYLTTCKCLQSFLIEWLNFTFIRLFFWWRIIWWDRWRFWSWYWKIWLIVIRRATCFLFDLSTLCSSASSSSSSKI